MATVFGSLFGFLVSYLLIPRYSASAILGVRDDLSQQCPGCGLPDKPYFQHKLANYLQEVFSPNNLRAAMERKRIVRPEDAEKVYREIHKKMTLRVGDPAGSPELDLIYTDSTPQRAEEFCSLLTSAIREKTRTDEEVTSLAFFNARRGPLGAISITGQPPHPYGLEVDLPCTSGTRDFSHSILGATIGSAAGLLFGVTLIAASRKSHKRIAETRG